MAAKKVVKDDRERTEELLNELAEIGSKAYIEEYRDSHSKWKKIGMAIAHTGMHGRGCYELANTVAEDWNWHSMVAIVDFLLGKRTWEYGLVAMQKAFSGKRQIVDTNRNVKISLTVEEIDPQYIGS